MYSSYTIIATESWRRLLTGHDLHTIHLHLLLTLAVKLLREREKQTADGWALFSCNAGTPALTVAKKQTQFFLPSFEAGYIVIQCTSQITTVKHQSVSLSHHQHE